MTSSPISGVTPDGALELVDGTRLAADLVIGADGVHSRVRDTLGLTHKMVNLRDGRGRHLVPRTSDDPVNVVMEEWSGGRRIGVVPSSPDWTYLFLCGPERDVACTEQQPFNHETWIQSFPHFRSQLERIPDMPEGRWAPFFDVTTLGWYRGRAAIVGDAAHAMSPNLGQAACMAMVNSVALAQALDRYDIDTALAVWENTERPVTGGYSGTPGSTARSEPAGPVGYSVCARR